MVPDDPISFLEGNIPDLVRRETSKRLTSRWVGEEIESYKVQSLIGTGNHGIVFHARRFVPYKKSVAIKLLPFLQQASNSNRFESECQALADLEHPNISQILSAGVTAEGTPYLIMPLLSGSPIDDFVSQNITSSKRPTDWNQILRLMRQLASAVSFAHEKGVVHCDLKPDNILVDQDGQLTVTDFGLAVRLDQMEDLTQRPSWAPGTIGYAAPEVLLSRVNASPSVDIYSIGAVLYSLLTGEPPNHSSGWLDSLVAAVNEDAIPVRARNPQVPKRLAEICDRCLARDPVDRFSSAADLEQNFKNAILERPDGGRFTPSFSAVFVTVVTLLVVFGWSINNWSLSKLNTASVTTAATTGASELPLQAPVGSPETLTDEEIERLVDEITQQYLIPGLKDPAVAGDYDQTFEILSKASLKLNDLLQKAPHHRKVRHRAATGYFLLGRAAIWKESVEFAKENLAKSERLFRELHRDYPKAGYMFDYFHTIFAQASQCSDNRERRDLHLMALGVIEALHETEKDNLDYADAFACMLMLLAEDYALEFEPDLFNMEKSEVYARRALELAEWTCSQPGSRPIHRKHIMSTNSVLGELARFREQFEESLKHAEIARLEAIRLDDALQVADTMHHRFDKTIRYAIALRDLGRIEESIACLDEIALLLQSLEDIDWPEVANSANRLRKLRESLITTNQ